MTVRPLPLALSAIAMALASCGQAASGEKARAVPAPGEPPYRVEVIGQFDRPWAMDIDPATGMALVTEIGGALKLRQPDGRVTRVTGTPKPLVGGQGGMGDVRLLPGEAASEPGLNGRTLYLSWVEGGSAGTRGAVVGRGKLACTDAATCRVEGMKVIWRQTPKVTGEGHFSHRIAFSPDGRYLFVSSGERQKMTPAQDMATNLGKVVRLTLDGEPAPGNPFADKPAPTNQIWSLGHRNVLGLAFDAAGQLWDLEHGPAGGDEINRVEPGRNYGWPLVSEGDHYDGKPIPAHATRPDLAAPAISWNPVIAPGDMVIYRGDLFPAWKGHALVAGMSPAVLVDVALDGNTAREVARHEAEHRLREIDEAPDGSVWLLEDGQEDGASRLLRLVPQR